MKKRLKSIICAAALLITSLIMPVSSAASTAADDGGNTTYELLCAIGFFDSDVVYKGSASVTRAEVITALINALPEEKRLKLDSYAECGFTDVADGDPISETAYNAKLWGILGEQTELRPYELATVEDTAGMVLNMLGYGGVVRNGYTTYAISQNLLRSGSAKKNITMEQFVTLLYNALDTGIMEKQMKSGEEVYEVSRNETYASKILCVTRKRGRITATEYASIGGEALTKTGNVRIGDELYLTGDVDIISHIGENTVFYYRTGKSDDKTLLYLSFPEKDSILELEGTSIDSFRDMTFTYRVGQWQEKTRKVRLSKSADIIYNGKNITEGFSAFVPTAGSVKLIHTNKGSDYDIAVITDYRVVVVNRVDANLGIVYDANHIGESYAVNLGDERSYDVRRADGSRGKFTDILRKHVIFAAQSMDKEFTRFVVSGESMEGMITSIGEDSIRINGKTYQLTEDFKENYSVELGSYGVFYLDPLGRCGAYENVSGNQALRVGYLCKVAKITGLDESLAFRVITESGMTETLYTSDSFYFTNGQDAVPAKTKVSNLDQVYNALLAGMNETYGGGQLILYRIDGNGKVRELETAAPYETDLSISNELNERGVFRQITQKETALHKSGNMGLLFRIGPNTKVFSVPSNIEDENKFQVYTGTDNCFPWNTRCTAIAFSKTPNAQYADYVLGFMGGASGTFDESQVFIVTDVLQVWDEEKEQSVSGLVGMWGTEEKMYTIDEEVSTEEFHKGDVLRLSLDTDGSVLALQRVLDSMRMTPETQGSLDLAYYSYLANAYSMSGSTLHVTIQDPSGITSRTDLINTYADQMERVFVFDRATERLTIGSYDDIVTYTADPNGYSKIYVWLYFGDHKTMVIYN